MGQTGDSLSGQTLTIGVRLDLRGSSVIKDLPGPISSYSYSRPRASTVLRLSLLPSKNLAFKIARARLFFLLSCTSYSLEFISAPEVPRSCAPLTRRSADGRISRSVSSSVEETTPAKSTIGRIR
ncbi:hypothetical protein H6P81_008666 [Aristolochia fimbriata]|uniref:Uncharacterized protein n=1 Tax=Aristolochia fimbriata TaxID=158543 RepID=A0AAV7EJY0_ARIFI|nr:hypothetical protein H6P81_008666 [Aristolochia fimbriata]